VRAARTALVVLAVAAVAAPGAFLWRERDRARHLALPVLAEAAAPAAAPAVELRTLPPCRIEEVARIGRRITALLPASDGTLWVGTFDDGVVRLGEGETPQAALGLAGRRRFVNALAEHGGVVWAATQGGLVALDDDLPGSLVVLADEGVTALATAGGRLYAGTARGLFRVSAGGAEAVAVAGPAGEPLRVTALAVSPPGALSSARDGRLWIGTASGAYSLPLATLTAPLLARTAAWHPLVFGDPPAETNVVTALVAVGDSAVAGTDDGGLVRIGGRGEISALRFSDPRANEVNPGAAAVSAGGAVFGTQGGGVLVARSRPPPLDAARVPGLEQAAVSAAWAGGEEVLVGMTDGIVLRVVCGGEGGVG
jgi:ligand-binding sensor domain-containing protein